MSSKLSTKIFHLLRNRIKSTSIRRLEMQGMQNVSVLHLEDLDDLVKDGVDRTLKEMGIALSPEELTLINEKTREKLLAVISDRDELKAYVKNMEQEMLDLRKNMGMLKTEIAVGSRLLEQEEHSLEEKEEVAPPPLNVEVVTTDLLVRVNEVFADAQMDEAMKEKMVSFSMAIIEEERQKASLHARSAQEERVDRLKRRIAKLNQKLEETEGLLHRIRSEGISGEGIASMYSEAQGLKDEAQYYEEKKALLKEIFELNMDLKQIMSES